MIPGCVFWCIWLERNNRCFNGESTALGILKTRCIANLFIWSNLYPTVNAEQLQDFTNSLILAQIVCIVSQRFFCKLKCHICKSCIFLVLPKSVLGLEVKDLALHNEKHAPEMAPEIRSRRNEPWECGDSSQLWQRLSLGLRHQQTPSWLCIWKEIRNMRPEFSMNSSLQVGDGNHILFQEDVWLGQSNLQEAYPTISPLLPIKTELGGKYLVSKLEKKFE